MKMLRWMAPLGLGLALAGCTVIDLRAHDDPPGVRSKALVSGYATAGWPAEASMLSLGIFDGPSDGAIFYFNLWKLLRVEVGVVGAAVGVGPLDLGLGVLFYEPQPPRTACDSECAPEPPAKHAH